MNRLPTARRLCQMPQPWLYSHDLRRFVPERAFRSLPGGVALQEALRAVLDARL